MAGGGLWHKSLVYFGLADEDDDYDDDVMSVRPDDEPSYRESYRDRSKVKRIDRSDSRRRQSSDFDDIFSEDDYREERPTSFSQQRSAPLRPVLGGLSQPQVKVHLVMPKSFNDAQVVADKYKNDIPVILNLQTSETDLAKRLIDFASGLTYALDGGMQRIADKVFLLTPRNVEVSAEERQRIVERGFFNQY
jgi:cell division inhibitor SepF